MSDIVTTIGAAYVNNLQLNSYTETLQTYNGVINDHESDIYMPMHHVCYDLKLFSTNSGILLHINRNEIASEQHYVSLALHKKNPQIFGHYISFLPLMCLNVRRINLTVSMLYYCFGEREDTRLAQKAIDYYISSDIITNDNLYSFCDAGHKFSNLLHLLKSSGYESYFVDLARNCGLNVDIAKNNNMVYSYSLNTKQRLDQCNKSDNFPSSILFEETISGKNSRFSSAIGTLTLIYDGNFWYGQVTSKPILISSD